MGYSPNTWNQLTKFFKQADLLNDKFPPGKTIITEEKYYGKEMLELGCQVLRNAKFSPYNRSACVYFNSIGIRCLSVDIKACMESISIDLRNPFPEYFYNRFDIVTNPGTTEHVVSIDGQYEAFKNMHICTKNGGVMIHFVPLYKVYKNGHSPFYYKKKFFSVLAKLNNYEIINMEVYNNRKNFLISACLRKINQEDFTTDKNKFFKYIHQVK